VHVKQNTFTSDDLLYGQTVVHVLTEITILFNEGVHIICIHVPHTTHRSVETSRNTLYISLT